MLESFFFWIEMRFLQNVNSLKEYLIRTMITLIIDTKKKGKKKLDTRSG